jgi:hypothetical protein
MYEKKHEEKLKIAFLYRHLSLFKNRMSMSKQITRTLHKTAIPLLELSLTQNPLLRGNGAYLQESCVG